VAKPTSSIPAVMTANHAMQKYYQNKEASPYKPEILIQMRLETR
jgi:hypothetical protein